MLGNIQPAVRKYGENIGHMEREKSVSMKAEKSLLPWYSPEKQPAELVPVQWLPARPAETEFSPYWNLMMEEYVCCFNSLWLKILCVSIVDDKNQNIFKNSMGTAFWAGWHICVGFTWVCKKLTERTIGLRNVYRVPANKGQVSLHNSRVKKPSVVLCLYF